MIAAAYGHDISDTETRVREILMLTAWRSVRDLNAKIRAFIDGWNDRAHPFVWTQDRRRDPQEGKP